MNEYINPASLPRPSGFSHAVVPPQGRTVYLAGQTALGDDGYIVSDDIVTQFARCLSNMLVALREAGGRPEHLVSTRIYIVDIPLYKERAREIGAVWRQMASVPYPASAGIGVSRLWDDKALVEVEGVAVIPGGR